MSNRESFIEGVFNYLNMPTSGALLISGAWGSGKTYYIERTLVERLKKENRFPVKVSLFGLEKTDGLERLITEKFLVEYGEENLSEPSSTDKESFEKIEKWLRKIKLRKIGKAADSITDFIPFFKQYFDMGRLLDAYYTLSAHRLPQDKLVIILDDLERAVESIEPHLLLGAINNLVETKNYKVIVVANDLYFNEKARGYLDFKEKVIERTLFFPPEILEVYKELVHECARDYGEGFESLMTSQRFIEVIDPLSECNRDAVELKENLKNIRIVKFALVHFAKVYEVFSESIKSLPLEAELQDFLLSLWALVLGLSIEYKRNRLSYQDRDAYLLASTVDSFVIDIGNDEPNPFLAKAPEDKEEKTELKKNVGHIRDIFKFYIERRSLPLIPSVQVFDAVTAGLTINKTLLDGRWTEYKQSLERKKENPAVVLLNRFLFSIGTFSDEEFPERLRELAGFVEQAAFPDDVSYINAATYLQRYGKLLGYDDKTVKEIITRGIDKFYKNVFRLSPIAKSRLDVLSSEVPHGSKWVLNYSLQHIAAMADRQEKDGIAEAIRQFNEGITALADRLRPNTSSMTTPDFFSYPILAKIPSQMVIDKIKTITPAEVEALSSIIRSRFVEHHTRVDFEEEKVFLDNVKKGIEARGEGLNSLSDYLIKDHLFDPLLSKLLNVT